MVLPKNNKAMLYTQNCSLISNYDANLTTVIFSRLALLGLFTVVGEGGVKSSPTKNLLQKLRKNESLLSDLPNIFIGNYKF